MSMFVCAECSNLADSDDGCEEAPASKYFPAHQLLCIDCVDNEIEPTDGTSGPITKGQDTINSPEIPESSLQPLRGDAVKKTVSFDARHGWRYVNQSGDWCGCPPPFVTHKQAVDYALQRLKATEDSPYAVIVDARAALEWAANL